MAFNWAGAAAGAYEGLQDAIKQRMVEQEFQQRQQAMADQMKWRELQAETNQLNAQSLADARSARAEDLTARRRQKDMLFDGARATVANQGADIDEAHRGFELARAQHILRYGEDLPDAAITSYYGQPKQKPAYVPKTAEEWADIEREKKIGLRYSATMNKPESSTQSTKVKWNEKYGKDPEFPTGPQNWLAGIVSTWVRNNDPYTDAFGEAIKQIEREFPRQLAQGNPYLSKQKVMEHFYKAWKAQAEGGSAKSEALRRSGLSTGNIPAPPER